MSLTSFVIAASEANGESSLNPFAVGGIALGLLLFALIALMMFGAGREHS